MRPSPIRITVPMRLPSLWLQLDQNIYRRDARSIDAERQGSAPNSPTASFSIRSRRNRGAGGSQQTISFPTRVCRSGCRCPSKRAGGTIANPHSGTTTRFRARSAAARPGPRRSTARSTTSRNGIRAWRSIDDLRGWDTLPYLGSEFYLEYGDFDYYVTVPCGHAGRRFRRTDESAGGADRNRSCSAWRRPATATRP